jgi:hypothetical protein
MVLGRSDIGNGLVPGDPPVELDAAEAQSAADPTSRDLSPADGLVKRLS